jgi:RimJ/RimL family protein N-acetyltransferase
VRATILGPEHTGALAAFLGQDVETNLFLLGLLDAGNGPQGRGEWVGVIDASGAFNAICFAGGRPGPGLQSATAVPYGESEACQVLGRWVATEGGAWMVIGPRMAADSLWQGLGREPDRIRFEQRLYVCTTVSEGPTLPVRLAHQEEAPRLARWASKMLHEDLGLEPQRINPMAHMERMRHRIQADRTRVAEENGQTVFLIDVGTWFGLGAQVGGTWVPPASRGRGVATRAMRGLCHELLAECQRVTLHVNEANLPAVRCYEAAGFVRAAAFRLIAS